LNRQTIFYKYTTAKPRETYKYNKPTSHELKTDINRPYYFSNKQLITFNRSNEVIRLALAPSIQIKKKKVKLLRHHKFNKLRAFRFPKT